MAERTRIRFNPSTGEIEVEGSETFVKTYFQKLQEALSDSGEKSGAAQVLRKATPSGKATNALRRGGEKKIGRKSQTGAVITMVRENTAGITTSELKARTGLTERQIWGIVYRAEKRGKIKKTKRGLYVAA